MVFPVVMYGCESWTIKKAEHRRTDSFELWCWRRLLRFPWTARRSSQSILKEIIPGCSLEGLILKLKLQYVGHLMWRADSFEKTLMLGGIEGRGEGDNRGWDGWMPSPTQWTRVWENSRSWWWTGRPGRLQFMGLQSRTWLRDWTELKEICDDFSLLKIKPRLVINVTKPATKYMKRKWNTTLGTVVSYSCILSRLRCILPSCGQITVLIFFFLSHTTIYLKSENLSFEIYWGMIMDSTLHKWAIITLD